MPGASDTKSDVKKPVVCSYNEWDPLEEIVVGVLDGGINPPWETLQHGFLTHEMRAFAASHKDGPGGPHEEVPGEVSDEPRGEIEGFAHMLDSAGTREEVPPEAHRELEGFVKRLESEGVIVRRPIPHERSMETATPDWKQPPGGHQTCPRDVMIVVGDEIIEGASPLRFRYYEHLAYRDLVLDYFKRGARWTQAPRPRLLPDLYRTPEEVEAGARGTTDVEPVLEPADIARCGYDLIVQRSHVTNSAGIDWLRRHLGDEHRVTEVSFDDYRAVHIDATWVPLAPGKVLVNPERPMLNPPAFLENAGWEKLVAPDTTLTVNRELFKWLHMNVLSLDEKRVIVEASEEPLIKALKGWGFEPIPVEFRTCMYFGGSFHCFTCDVRRRGTKEKYF